MSKCALNIGVGTLPNAVNAPPDDLNFVKHFQAKECS